MISGCRIDIENFAMLKCMIVLFRGVQRRSGLLWHLELWCVPCTGGFSRR